VQTLPSLRETREFLHLAAATDFIHGVVGWVDLTSPSVADDLDALLDGPAGRWLAGIRHQVHDEPDPDWLARADVHRGLAAVQIRGLTYDLSGMVTEADWATWSPHDLRPFVSQVAGWFGVPRLMFGSAWPVCLLAGSYQAVLDGLYDALPAMPAAELDQILGTNALRVYQLGDSAAAAPGPS
jgi:L-fuconolactonase